MNTTPARDAAAHRMVTGAEHLAEAYRYLDAYAAEVRAAALTDAAGALEAHCHRHGDGEATFADCLCAAAHELRRMAAAARPDNTEGA